MNPNLYTAPLSDTSVDDIVNKDGLLETQPSLDLNLPDAHIIQNLHSRIQNSIDYYNDTMNFNLRNKRIKNMRMLRGDQLNEHQLYHYQTPWKDNELFVGIDAMISYATSAYASPEVFPSSKNIKSKMLAKDLKTYIKSYLRKFKFDKTMEEIVLHLFSQYVGVLKFEWDPNYGKNGEIIVRAVNPTNLIIDKNARRGANPAFICEVHKDSLEGLVSKFPEKEAEVMKLYGVQRKGVMNTSKELAYREVHFTYYEENKPEEAVAFYLNNIVLAKHKNPNWLVGSEGENFLDNQKKPYIPFNLFNDGEHWIDFTSSLEQAVPPQDILNKEGRQVIDNLSTANGFRIAAAGAMTDDVLENLTGDPNQTVVVKLKQGQRLDDVYKQILPHIVSPELMKDKDDTRNTIHNILGTPSQFRGSDPEHEMPASEAAMIKNQASGRQDRVVRAINSGLNEAYEYLVQMIQVWYTEKHKITSDGGDGNFDFIEMHQNNVEPGMTIQVYAQPSADKARQEAITQNAAELGLLSPIDYYKGMHMEDPQKLYDNLVKWKSDPQQLAMDIADDTQDRDAIMDFAELMDGQKPSQREDITPKYLEQFRKCMISDEFTTAKKSLQNKVIAFVNKAKDTLNLRNELEQASAVPELPQPLPSQVQQTLPPPQPPQMPSVPPMQAMSQMAAQGAGAALPPQAPPMGAQPPMGAGPLPQTGIQGVMQNAGAPTGPNLNPNVQPHGAVDVASLVPR